MIFIKKISTKGLKVFFIYALALAILSFFSTFSLLVLQLKNFYFYLIKIYTIVEYSLLTLMFYFFYEKKTPKIFLLFIAASYWVFFVTMNYRQHADFNSYPLLIEFFSFILFIIYYFSEKILIPSFQPIYKKISFWICVGLFFYFTGNFFYILLVENSRNQPAEVKNQLILIYSLVTITKNLILGFSIWIGDESDNNPNNFIPFPENIDLDTTTPNYKPN